MAKYVYAIKNDTNKLIKIGRSRNPKQRLRSLQTGSPDILRLIYILEVEDDSLIEKCIHRVLWQRRDHGEWFNIEEDEIEEVFREGVLEAENNPRMKNGKTLVNSPPCVLGQKILEVRRLRKITLADLSEKAQVSINTIARIEQGWAHDIRSGSLLKIAEALDVSCDYLVGRKRSMTVHR